MSDANLPPEPKPEGFIESLDKALDRHDVPNTLSRWQAIRSMVFASVVILIGVAAGVAIYGSRHHRLAPALIVFGVVSGMGVFMLVTARIAYVQLRNAARNPPPFTHFQTSTAEVWALPLDFKDAVIDETESVDHWFGPVTMATLSRSYGVIAKEVDRNAINTLLFTHSQVIGLMLGPADLENLQGPSAVKGLANVVLKHVQEGGWAKTAQFEALNANHWDEMVDALRAEPLAAALKNHLNFGLPYGKVQGVEMKDHLVNPGLTFHLTDGKKIRYATFKRDRLPELARYLKQYVTVT